MASHFFLLSVLLFTFTSVAVNGDITTLLLALSPPPTHPPPPTHHNQTHPPSPSPSTHPPAKPPTHPPVKPPTKAPTHPPVTPLRKKVYVHGVVYCKSCKYRGLDKELGLKAAPLSGAIVKLQCNNTKHGLVEEKKTDKNGYFYFTPEKVSSLGFHKCKVFLVSSPLHDCSVATNYHDGLNGAKLYPGPTPKTLSSYQLFSVGPFAFEPAKTLPCH